MTSELLRCDQIVSELEISVMLLKLVLSERIRYGAIQSCSSGLLCRYLANSENASCNQAIEI